MWSLDRAHLTKFENICGIFHYTAADKTQKQSMQLSEASNVAVRIWSRQEKKIPYSPGKFPIILSCWIGWNWSFSIWKSNQWMQFVFQENQRLRNSYQLSRSLPLTFSSPKFVTFLKKNWLQNTCYLTCIIVCIIKYALTFHQASKEVRIFINSQCPSLWIVLQTHFSSLNSNVPFGTP